MISAEELVLRLVVAAVLGGLVGLERERLEWAAGMRTHALVSLGSALFMVVSIFGFIGAGTIILRREIVKGLTTAASIWAVAAVGLAVGGGMFLASVAATVLALAILVLAKLVKKRLFPNRKARFVTLVIDQNTPLAELRSEIDASNLSLDRIVVRPGPSRDKDSAELVLGKGSDEENLLSLTDKLRRISGVHEVNSLLDGAANSKN